MKFDVIVAGGGLAGCGAAISAARGGAKVIIIEKSGFLGGAAANCYVNPFMPFHTRTDGKPMALSAGVFAEILDRLEELGGLGKRGIGNIMFNEETLKLVLDRMAKENNITVLFHSYITDIEKDGEHIKSISCVNKSGKQTFYADYFIDATGDADVAALAGCPFRVGREEDGLCQPMTLCFRLSGVDIDKAFNDGGKINDLYRKFREENRIKNPRENVLRFHHMSEGVLHLNSTRIIKKSPLNGFDLSDAEMEAREQAFELYAFLKENCEGFENAVLHSSAPEIGVRESRMIDGHYILNKNDLIECTKFDDGIAACNYDIDIHNPDGSGTSHYYFKDNSYYTIPYRCLLPMGTDNLLVAGRCISGTHEAQASYRIMPVCCCIGEAAGTAAALALKNQSSVNDVDTDELRKVLQDNHAFV